MWPPVDRTFLKHWRNFVPTPPMTHIGLSMYETHVTQIRVHLLNHSARAAWGVASKLPLLCNSAKPCCLVICDLHNFAIVNLFILHICRVVENGEETVTVEENGVLTSKTIGGVQQAITGKK